MSIFVQRGFIYVALLFFPKFQIAGRNYTQKLMQKRIKQIKFTSMSTIAIQAHYIAMWF